MCRNKSYVFIILFILVIVCHQRNLQFTHYVPEFRNPQPNRQTYGYYPFLNPFDPYKRTSFSVGYGNNLNGPSLIVKCKKPL